MKLTIFIFMVFSTICCNQSSVKLVEKEKYHFRLLLNHFAKTNSSFAIKTDSIFILTPKLSDPQAAFIYFETYKPSNDGSYSFDLKGISAINGIDVIKRISAMPIFFKNIDTPNIKYENISAEVNNILAKKGVVINETKFHYYDEKIYFTNRGNSKFFYIYENKTDSLIRLDNLPVKYGGHLDLRDFFLFDLTGDNNPEIIVLSGRLPRKELLSLDVLSIVKP